MKQLKCLTAVAALLCTIPAPAQFINSTNAEAVAGSSFTMFPTKTSSDAKFYRLAPGNPLQMLNVIAWDGTLPGIYYFTYFAGPAPGNIPLPTGASEPDVIISSDNNFLNTQMIVVYKLGSNFNCDIYSWSAGGFPSMSTNSATWSDFGSGYTPSINIDATGNGDYAIVIGYSDGSIEVYSDNNFNLPGMIPSLTATLLPGTGQQTDICVNSTMGGTTNVHLSYTDQNNSTLYTQFTPFGLSAFSTAAAIGTSTPGTYMDPRIASNIINSPSCPTFDIFSIIYDSVDASGNYVHLYSEENGSSTNVTLTANNPGFPPLALTYPRRPVVTYDEAYEFYVSPCSGQLITAFEAGPSITNRSVLGEKLQGNGTIWGPVRYYDVNNPSRPNCAYPSISSKYSGDRVLVSFYDDNIKMVKYKSFGYGDPTMRAIKNRAIESAAEGTKDVAVYPNPAADHIYLNYHGVSPDAMIQLQVTDITGRVHYSISETAEELQSRSNDWFSLLAPGVYFLQCSDGDGFSKTMKLVKE